jgi:hypothetical protein
LIYDSYQNLDYDLAMEVLIDFDKNPVRQSNCPVGAADVDVDAALYHYYDYSLKPSSGVAG